MLCLQSVKAVLPRALHGTQCELCLMQFLDASQPWAPFAYLGLFAVHWVFFGFVILLLQIKYWILQYFSTSRQQLEVQMAKVE